MASQASQLVRLEIKCFVCNHKFIRAKVTIDQSKKRYGHYRCASCVAKSTLDRKPQCQPGGWSVEKRTRHRAILKNSERHRQSMTRRDLRGENNPRYGIRVTAETRAKMSASRTGKTGIAATGWRGGKCSLTRLVKDRIYRIGRWPQKVIKRDKKCVECGSTRRLDAHHVRAISHLIRECLALAPSGLAKDKLADWLFSQPQIYDPTLENGKTLCRFCHKAAHKNWGSHTPVAA